MLYYDSEDEPDLFHEGLCSEILENFINRISRERPLRRVMLIPPDFTRLHSRAGKISQILYSLLGDKIPLVLPALGTHKGMSLKEKSIMFTGIPSEIIKDHDHKKDVVELGRIHRKEVEEISAGAVDYDWPVQVNRSLVTEDWDLVISIGQVVPHEVAGMSNFTKNTLVGLGGKECIDKSHFIGACCNMEKVMGRINSPVRKLLDLGSRRYLADIPLVYIHTVVSPDMKGGSILKGLFIGDDEECYIKAAALAQKTNIFLLDEEPRKILVSLNAEEYKSTWLGNKSIYRTRLALADKAELIVLAPGICRFGENPEADYLIRKYGYRGIAAVQKLVKENQDLALNLGTASHLIHGSGEGRFTIRYCSGFLSREEIRAVGYAHGDIEEYKSKYEINKLQEGWNDAGGERIFYIANPALGLWAYRKRFHL